MPSSWGRVARLGLTPLKGGAHHHPESLVVSPDGPFGDRAYALVEQHRSRGASVVRTVENPAVLRVRPRLDGAGTLHLDVPGAGPFAVTQDTPSDGVVVADYWGRATRLALLPGPWDDALSRLLERPVRLVRVGTPGAVVYAEAVTLVTTSSLRELAHRAGARTIDDERFRATVLVDTGDGPPFAEDDLIGSTVSVGEVRIEVRAPVARCAVTRLRPGTAQREADDPLRLLAPDRTVGREVVFGVGAAVVRPGVLRLGDAVGSVPR